MHPQYPSSMVLQRNRMEPDGSLAILLADSILDMVLFDTGKHSVLTTYEDVLKWLNGQSRYDFYQNAFSE